MRTAIVLALRVSCGLSLLSAWAHYDRGTGGEVYHMLLAIFSFLLLRDLLAEKRVQ